jgi:hypothetical protein
MHAESELANLLSVTVHSATICSFRVDLRQLQLVGFGGLQSHRLCVTNSLIMRVPYFTVKLLILKTVIGTRDIQQLIDGLLSNYRQWSKNEEVEGGEE